MAPKLVRDGQRERPLPLRVGPPSRLGQRLREPPAGTGRLVAERGPEPQRRPARPAGRCGPGPGPIPPRPGPASPAVHAQHELGPPGSAPLTRGVDQHLGRGLLRCGGLLVPRGAGPAGPARRGPPGRRPRPGSRAARNRPRHPARPGWAATSASAVAVSPRQGACSASRPRAMYAPKLSPGQNGSSQARRSATLGLPRATSRNRAIAEAGPRTPWSPGHRTRRPAPGRDPSSRRRSAPGSARTADRAAYGARPSPAASA